jgi:hypothetical protein
LCTGYEKTSGSGGPNQPSANAPNAMRFETMDTFAEVVIREPYSALAATT